MSQEDFSDGAPEPVREFAGDDLTPPGMEVEEPEVMSPAPPKTEPSVAQQKAPSKASRLFRKVMLYLIAGLVFFSLGIVATWYVKVIPVQQEAETARTAVVEEIARLEAQIAEDDLHFHLLNSLVDVYSAQVAIGQEDAAGVRAALAGTDSRLEMVETALEDDSASAIAALRAQLERVIDAIDGDLESATSGLERLASNLLAFERSMYGE